MNQNTKESLLKFINELELYLSRNLHFSDNYPIDTLLAVGSEVKQAIKKDETII